MAAETYKLTYFDLRGRGELARLMFFMADQKFEDNRIAQQDWVSFKPKTPQGFLPILETSKGVISQAVSVNMHVAGQMGFIPEDAFDRTQSSSILITINDLMSYVSENFLMSEVYKAIPTPADIEQKTAAVHEKIRSMLSFVDTVTKNGTKFLFGDKPTVADFLLFLAMEDYTTIFPKVDFKNERYKNIMANMKADSKFTKYLQQRK